MKIIDKSSDKSMPEFIYSINLNIPIPEFVLISDTFCYFGFLAFTSGGIFLLLYVCF